MDDAAGNESVGSNGQKDKKKKVHVVDTLYEVILSRRGADPGTSHTAGLFARGTEKICEKVGEESIELIIEAIKGDRDRLISESADLVYHLLVLWAHLDVEPGEVWMALKARRGMSGVEEKARRGRRP